MKAGFVAILLVIGFSVMLTTPIAHAQAPRDEGQNQDKIKVEDDIKADLARQLGLAAKKQVGADAAASPLVPPDVAINVARQLPSKCIKHFRKDIDKLNKGEFTRDSWFGHIRECRTCCAPLMIEVFGAHVTMVAAGPHEILFFDYDDDTLKESFKERVNSLFQEKFNKDQHRVLLIGRSSKTGDPVYNERLSRKRVENVKQYLKNQGLINDSIVMSMFFGYYPPQLTPAIAVKYGIEFQDLDDVSFRKGKDPLGHFRINQSVVVVLYKAQDSAHDG